MREAAPDASDSEPADGQRLDLTGLVQRSQGVFLPFRQQSAPQQSESRKTSPAAWARPPQDRTSHRSSRAQRESVVKLLQNAFDFASRDAKVAGRGDGGPQPCSSLSRAGDGVARSPLSPLFKPPRAKNEPAASDRPKPAASVTVSGCEPTCSRASATNTGVLDGDRRRRALLMMRARVGGPGSRSLRPPALKPAVSSAGFLFDRDLLRDVLPTYAFAQRQPLGSVVVAPRLVRLPVDCREVRRVRSRTG